MDQFLNEDNWLASNCWVACFDILGFRSLVCFNKDEDEVEAYRVRFAYQRTLENLKESCSQYKEGHVDYCWFSDTFLMFTPDDSKQSYVMITFAAKCFIEDFLHSSIPMRAAISVGPFVRTTDKKTFMGQAFLEAFEYAEDQDWIGLIITPDAIKKAESYGLFPVRHDFVASKDIPMRKFKDQDLVAYRFQNGASNRPSLLARGLRSMKARAPRESHSKYERTAKFIEEHYRYIERD